MWVAEILVLVVVFLAGVSIGLAINSEPSYSGKQQSLPLSDIADEMVRLITDEFILIPRTKGEQDD